MSTPSKTNIITKSPISQLDPVAQTLKEQLEVAHQNLEADSQEINSVENQSKNPQAKLPVTGFNQTEFILNWSKFSNGVAQKHQEVTAQNYPNHQINCITNGVHLPTWTSTHLKKIFDQHFSNWQKDNFLLKLAQQIPLQDLSEAKKSAKKDLFTYVEAANGVSLDPKVMTIGFARRAVAYKRADFIFGDLDRLADIAKKFGGLQLIFSGKAHPQDDVGRLMISRVFARAAQIADPSLLKVVYLANYNMQISSLMVAGCDLWLNNPTPPLEASGTSGMKAALNGTPNLSILDGWWLEGWLEGVTGWAIGSQNDTEQEQLNSLYHKLETQILPIFGSDRWLEICRSSIALNAGHFSTDRVVMEYLTRSWS